jgi:hypothetical protein
MTNATSLSASVEAYLAPLIGKPLWSCGRAADLLWLQFGSRHTLPTARGTTRDVGDYALHVQCAWRISCGHGLVTASEREPSDVIDKQLSVFVGRYCPAVVEAIAANEGGGFSLSLEGRCRFEVFPDGQPEEQWRLLQPGAQASHLGLVGSDLVEL